MRPVDRPTGDRRDLERLLGTAETAWLRDRVRNRLLAADGSALTGVVSLASPSSAQRSAATELVGPPRRPGRTLRIDLAEVEAILRRGPWPAGLADAVITLTGPVLDRRQERLREVADWDRTHVRLDAAVREHPRMEPWWRALCAGGGLKRLVRAEASRVSASAGPGLGASMVDDLSRLLTALPQSGVPIAVFARSVLGDAHALDESRPLGRLAAAAVGAAFTPPGDAPSRREAWARAGVVLSNVSSTVLVLGVAGSRLTGRETEDGPTAGRADAEAEHDATQARHGGALALATSRALTAMRIARAPMLLTLDQVRSGGVRPAPPNAVVHVCENPTIIEVAASHWAVLNGDAAALTGLPTGPGTPGPGAPHASAAPDAQPILVCTSGQASTAVLELLETLTSQGAVCRYHGDFDWAGLRIARTVGARVPWTPWRYTAGDYLAGLEDGASSLQLAGEPVDSPWDPQLSAEMAQKGIALEEEAVADLLAADFVAHRPLE